MPIQCYKVSVKKEDEKCIIKSQSLLSFFLLEAPKEALSKYTSISSILYCCEIITVTQAVRIGLTKYLKCI